MTSYRPVCDTWILARAKLLEGHTYYGSYPGGLLKRARDLMGINRNQPMLHVCGGKAKFYPYKSEVGPNDKYLDLDPSLQPDFLQDARDPFPSMDAEGTPWPAILMDPPYTETDAEQYVPGKKVFPSPNLLLKNALDAVQPGGKVGLLHYILPQPPQERHCGYSTRLVAVVGVIVGFNNRIRCFSVYEKVEGSLADESEV